MSAASLVTPSNHSAPISASMPAIMKAETTRTRTVLSPPLPHASFLVRSIEHKHSSRTDRVLRSLRTSRCARLVYANDNVSPSRISKYANRQYSTAEYTHCSFAGLMASLASEWTDIEDNREEKTQCSPACAVSR